MVGLLRRERFTKCTTIMSTTRIRNATAMIDVSPLYKYLLTGKDTTKLVNRVITRDINKVAVGQ